MTTHIYVSILALSMLLFSACGSREGEGAAGEVPGVEDFFFSMERGRATLSVVFTDLRVDAGLQVPLGTIRDSYIELSPDFQSNGMLFQVSVSLRQLFSGGENLARFGLPDGRPIPHIRSGSLLGRLIDIPVFNWGVLYQEEDIFGIFLPLNLNLLPLNVTVRMRDEFGNLLGVFTAIAKGDDEDISGVLFLFPVEGSTGEREIMRSLN